MKDVVRQTLLLDYYGALLTQKQRDIYDWYYQQDMSLAEIGEVAGVSRNAVHDLIGRTHEKLERFEKALGLIEVDVSRGAAQDGLQDMLGEWLRRYGDGLTDEAKADLERIIHGI